MDRGEAFVLVETLSPDHFRHAHLPRAINLPPDSLTQLAPALLPNKDVEVIVYCANADCHASENAAHDLIRLGYKNVRRYPGGKRDWIAAGLPMQRASPTD